MTMTEAQIAQPGKMSRRIRAEVNGWVILDKPVGMTSTYAVSRLKRLFNAKKAGHAGTLDPLASGLLPIALGEATKTVPFVQDGAKSYRFRVRWGIQTDSDDTEGKVVATSDLRPAPPQIEALLPSFEGTIMQRPPAYSAIKVDGERAYDRARDGEVFELATRPITIHSLRLIESSLDEGGVRSRLRQRHLCAGDRARPRGCPRLLWPCQRPATHACRPVHRGGRRRSAGRGRRSDALSGQVASGRSWARRGRGCRGRTQRRRASAARPAAGASAAAMHRAKAWLTRPAAESWWRSGPIEQGRNSSPTACSTFRSRLRRIRLSAFRRIRSQSSRSPDFGLGPGLANGLRHEFGRGRRQGPAEVTVAGVVEDARPATRSDPRQHVG